MDLPTARRRLLFAPFAAAAGRLLAAPATGEVAPQAACRAPARRRFGEMLGLGVKFAQGQPERDLELLLDLRVRWIRDAVHWGQIEPVRDRLGDFTPAFRRQLDFYRRHDIGVVALLTLQNARAYQGATPASAHDPAAFGRFARHVAALLRAAGVRFVLEIGNEPHSASLAKALGGAWNGRPPSPWVDHYVRMVHAAVDAVKGWDASIRLLSDDDMWVLHYWFLKAGLPRALDGFAVHPYTPGPPERAAVDHDTEWTRPFTVVDPDRSFTSAVRRLREQGRAALACTPEIWLTEWGWAVGGPEVRHAVPEATAAAYLPRAFVLAAAAGVEVLCWFSAHDAVDGPMGLLMQGGARRATYQAFHTMSAQLHDHVLVRHAAGASTPSAGLQAYVFEGPRGARLVAWSVDGRERRLPWRTGAATAPGVDTLGRPLALLDDPQPAVAIAAAPLYLDLDAADADIDARLAAAA